MSKIGVWHILPAGPAKLKEAEIDLEKHLEEWIEADPSLVQSGLVIVSRQMTFPGGRLDLLALDPQGRWVIIEIKAGAVRNETIGQAFYYAAVIDQMPFETLKIKVNEYLRNKGQNLETLLKERGVENASEQEERDIQILLIGTKLSSGLEQVVNYLSVRHEIPLSVISFDVYLTTTGERVLVRELTESDVTQSPEKHGRKLTAASLDELQKMANQRGAGAVLSGLVEAANRHGLHYRTYAGSIMFAPPQNKTRMLFTVWTRGKKPGMLRAYVSPEIFSQYFGVSEDEAKRLLGPDGWRELDLAAAEQLIAGLDQLLAQEQQGE